MLFNSLPFLAFFALVYLAYWLLQRLPNGFKVQNVLLLGASYYFYGYWDWRFCLLLAGTTLIQFFLARELHRETDKKRKKLILALAVTLSLTILGIFKYFNFFAESLEAMLATFGMSMTHSTLHLVLPVGMSFYTFKEISYVVDIYRGKLEPAKNLVHFALYVSFFPQLVSGPIERAGEMLPQIAKRREITAQFVDTGLYLILWGLFKKMVIADNLATISAPVFDNYANYSGLDVILGVLAYAGQIYCDFSGYTDVARGIAKLFGFELPLNFKLPYLAESPSDFWTRWHITLSQWLRDYLYISLGGNRASEFKIYRNLMITMLLGGLWHGAAWNFVAWGGYHGLILCLYRAWDKQFPNRAPAQGIHLAARISFMFVLTLVGWVLFRANSMGAITHILTSVGFSTSPETGTFGLKLVLLLSPLLLVQWAQARTRNLLAPMFLPAPARIAWQSVLLVGIFMLGSRESAEFIYFQF